ncbi:unnamed protein product [Soboliphyme baturini]|uniref:Protein RFT1 homolog n=1 Tax=Soboliphyme baturini TaxID=241478 RepID=A0A183J4A3_9BILA|nr:unnamed protein product [Soboliphyme baturini]
MLSSGNLRRKCITASSHHFGGAWDSELSRLMLLYTTVSFFSRESFRKTCVSDAETAAKPAAINVTWLCPVVSLAMGTVFCAVWLTFLSNPETMVEGVHHYRSAVFMYAASLFIESLAEPLWILSQSFNFVLLKVDVSLRQVND